jgi:hypothetical protein
MRRTARHILAAGLAAVGLAAGALASGSAAAQSPYGTGNWVGNARFVGERLEYCEIRVGFQSGKELAVRVDGLFAATVRISDPTWRYQAGKGGFNVVLEIEPGYKRAFQADAEIKADSANSIIIVVGRDTGFRQAFMSGAALKLIDNSPNNRGAKVADLSIEGGGNALRKAMACAALYAAQ